MRYLTILTAVIAGFALAIATPAVAVAPAAKPVPFLSVDAAYKQFVSARAAFVQLRSFERPDLVRWSYDALRYRRMSRTVVDWKTTMTFDIPGAEPSQYVPAERAALWIRVRRFRDAKGVVRTRWYDAHGGTGFERTPVTTLVPATPPPAGIGS
jgi:hypothetical protein